MKKKIIVRGPALSRSGYGEQTRFALRSLKHHEDKFDIYLHTTPWGSTSWITEDNEERQWMDNLIQKTLVHGQTGGRFDVSLQITIPGEWERLAPINIGYTAGIETTKLSAQWVDKTYIMDKIIVPSNHSKYAFDTTSWQAQLSNGQVADVGCKTPVEVVSFPAKNSVEEKIELDLSTEFNFLCVAQLSPRKNFFNTLKWFVEEFHDDESVGIVLKVSLAKGCLLDRQASSNQLANFMSGYPDRKCKVYLLHGNIADEQMVSLYKNEKIKAIVSTSHGEGFGLPLFEAAQAGLPVIAPNWGGQKDFLYMPVKNKKSKKEKLRPMFTKVEFALGAVQPEAVWENVIIPESMWCYPKEHSFKQGLRKVYGEYGLAKSQAKKLQKYVADVFNEDKQYDAFVSALALNFDSNGTKEPIEQIEVFK